STPSKAPEVIRSFVMPLPMSLWPRLAPMKLCAHAAFAKTQSINAARILMRPIVANKIKTPRISRGVIFFSAASLVLAGRLPSSLIQLFLGSESPEDAEVEEIYVVAVGGV